MSAVPSSNTNLASARDFQPGASLWRLRPTFEFPVLEDREKAIEKLQDEYFRNDQQGLFLMHGEYGELHLPTAEHRLWSPHLSFYVTRHDDRTLIHGRFAPRMDVWTFVWVLYLAMAFSAFFGLALAYSQMMLAETPWGTAVAIAGVLGIFTLYAIAHVGQHWSADQMVALRTRLDDVLRRAGVKCPVQHAEI